MNMTSLDKYARDYEFLQQDDSFNDALNTLSCLEIKVSDEAQFFMPEEVKRYENARNLLYDALQARVSPESFYDCWAESILAGAVTLLAGLVPTMAIFAFFGLSGYDKNSQTMRTIEVIAIGMFGGGFGACAGHYILSKLKGKNRQKKAEEIDLNFAYRHYLEALTAFKDIDEIKSYNEKKAKEIGVQNIADALKSVKEYLTGAEMHFKLHTYEIF